MGANPPPAAVTVADTGEGITPEALASRHAPGGMERGRVIVTGIRKRGLMGTVASGLVYGS
ncbi:MAG: hypothetical protein Kow00122_08510 [Thermoleophilia bacterium]